MLTLRRFRAMVASYGADLHRWPPELRDEVPALLQSSAEARALLDEARALDAAIGAAREGEDAVVGPSGSQDAALDRLRSGVQARIAASSPRRPPRWLERSRLAGALQAALRLNLRWAGVACGAALAIVAGFLIGAICAPAPPPDALLTMLELAPVQLLSE